MKKGIVCQDKRTMRYDRPSSSVCAITQPVRTELDVETRDKYGRVLAYAYVPDGRILNEEVVRAGHAAPMTVPPNVKYQDMFVRASTEARERRKG